ncbi:hypothetical protein [Bartonella sp. AP36NXGY]|uniref:hypothetical protein n=1 Tax=Bartonella sp. AP36NXGY TaxID=3243493 RepID=UPI0035CED9C2
MENFKKAYPESDLKVIGTLVVRLAWSHVSQKLATNLVVTRLNLEDLLTERFYNIIEMIKILISLLVSDMKPVLFVFIIRCTIVRNIF